MPGNVIRIDEIEIPDSNGRPLAFEGIHSGAELSGIELEITVYAEEDIQNMQQLFNSNTVTVEDPFVGREYEARLHKRSSGYQEGDPERWYNFEVRELDKPIAFELLEIEGHTFTVLKNTEEGDDVNDIGIYVLLRLSPQEFREFQGLLRLPQVSIRRIGIDKDPIDRRFGAALYWSSHEEGSQRFHKQIARFFPIDSEPSKVSILLDAERVTTARAIVELHARYEALVGTLVDKGQLTDEEGSKLISQDWKELVNAEREDIIRSKLTEVRDAELLLE